MRIGMLWFDDNKSRNLEDKVERAAEHYEAKFALRPTICFVHPTMLGNTTKISGIEIKGSNTVLPHHLWIGRNDDRQPAPAVVDRPSLWTALDEAKAEIEKQAPASPGVALATRRRLAGSIVHYAILKAYPEVRHNERMNTSVIAELAAFIAEMLVK